MNNSEFNTYKTAFRTVIETVLTNSEKGRLDETGFPAYQHKNPLINWLFWQRLRKVMDYLAQNAPYEHILDFGCGSGVMLPFLCTISKYVTATDIDLLPLKYVSHHQTFPPNLQTHDLREKSLMDLPQASFDIIVATDVLEHVEDLPGTLTGMKSLLKPGGQIVISGPTENIFYRVGRALAGPEYSGDYHQRNIQEIHNLVNEHMQIIPIATLYWPAPLFEIFAGQI